MYASQRRDQSVFTAEFVSLSIYLYLYQCDNIIHGARSLWQTAEIT